MKTEIPSGKITMSTVKDWIKSCKSDLYYHGCTIAWIEIYGKNTNHYRTISLNYDYRNKWYEITGVNNSIMGSTPEEYKSRQRAITRFKELDKQFK